MAATRLLSIPGPAGAIDVALDLPAPPSVAAAPVAVGRSAAAGASAVAAASITGIAVIAHPHPLQGGTRDHKVVQTMVRAFQQAGCACWRPNFRGVGGTAGEFDDGRGESDDLLAVIEHAAGHETARALGVPVRLYLAGFSFGGYVQTLVAPRIDPRRFDLGPMILLGPAAAHAGIQPVPADSLVIHGETDDVVTLAAVMDWARPQALPVTVIPGSGHFFHGQLNRIKSLILRHIGVR